MNSHNLSSEAILEVKDLHTYLFTRKRIVRAVDGISFILHRGETLGIVGESGCGKSMTALSILRLLPKPAGRIVHGSIRFLGKDLTSLTDEGMRKIRGKYISMILQDPQTSLNPVYTVGPQLIEALSIRHSNSSRSSLKERAIQALRNVQIAAPEKRVDNFPHQMSGGMKQRVVGAISISCEPKVLIADEPTTSLDLTIQAQYLRLLQSIKEKTGLSMIFITHDFGIVAKMCDRVAVMYAGRIVEVGSVRSLFFKPHHPYTKALMDSVPSPKHKVKRLASIEGQPPPLWDLPVGCRFADRCSYVMPRCLEEYPPMRNTGDSIDSGEAACWLLGDA